jgi:hypothetical protein
MRNNDLLRACCRLAALTASLWLCGCDSNFFGPELKEIAAGYQLKKSKGSNEFALTIPYQSGGLIIDEIGWRKPFIIARGSGSQYWDVINTARAQHTRISDLDLKSDATYRSIETKAPEVAWSDLSRHNPVW